MTRKVYFRHNMLRF